MKSHNPEVPSWSVNIKLQAGRIDITIGNDTVSCWRQNVFEELGVEASYIFMQEDRHLILHTDLALYVCKMEALPIYIYVHT